MLTRLARSVGILSVLGVLLAATGTTAAQPASGTAPPQQRSFDQYVPVEQLPATERMPAAPFLISAYVAVWLLAMLYISTIWQRLNRLDSEFRALEHRKHVAR